MVKNKIHLIPENEIAVNDFEDACTITKILLKNNNAVLMTCEEDLFIINWIWCEGSQADRNETAFMSREDLYNNFIEVVDCENEPVSEPGSPTALEEEVL